VLYLHDAQNLFDGLSARPFEHSWRVDVTARRLMLEGAIEPMVIVGVAHAAERRIAEFSPTADASHEGSGQAAEYGRHLVEEIKPFIDRCYRTLSDASHTAVGGSSLGGLVTLDLFLRHPGVFGKLGLLSPSAWWDDYEIVRRLRRERPGPTARVWLDVGAREGPKMITAARRVRTALTTLGWHPEDSLRYEETPGARHNEHDWSERIEPMLRYLFPRGTVGYAPREH
jgi:predicted alpha/beta superfamily hydrolase